mgnify:CR=1 FL=1
MTQDQFYNWLENPSAMDTASTPQLREVIKRYPYFEMAQMLLAKNLKVENHIDQLNQLQLAAIMAPDRKLFHDYLNDKRKSELKVAQVVEEVQPEKAPIETASESELVEIEHESLYDLIPEPIVYQLETAELPELPIKEVAQDEETLEPEELSFNEWLEYTESGKTDLETPEPERPKKSKSQPSRSNIELVDHFLSQQKERPKKRAEFFNSQKAGAKSLEEDFTVVSETLAKIYVQQEKYELASQAYEALGLKYPEKSVYFAARLKEINEKLNSE